MSQLFKRLLVELICHFILEVLQPFASPSTHVFLGIVGILCRTHINCTRVPETGNKRTSCEASGIFNVCTNTLSKLFLIHFALWMCLDKKIHTTLFAHIYIKYICVLNLRKFPSVLTELLRGMKFLRGILCMV